jgi:RNA polymerase primary sigma factor
VHLETGRRLSPGAVPGLALTVFGMTQGEAAPNTSAVNADSLAQYLCEIGRRRLLTPAEEVLLAKRIEQGDVAAVHRMVESNLRLVVAVARGHAYRGVPPLDLIQEGTLGLMRAAERFDWRRGTRFSTYAMWWIRQAIERAVCNQSDPIRVPSHVHERRRRLAKAEQALEFELGRKPSVDELASAADLTTEQAEQALGARHGFTSLDATEVDDARIADPHACGEYERVERRLSVTRLEEMVALLEPQQRRVIELRFGLRGEECSTERTADLLDTSARRVAALERRALRRLRELSSPLELRFAA